MAEICRIELMGELSVQYGGQKITHFRTQKAGALLAYLAYFPKRIYSREELADRLWPDSDSLAGRGNLRTELSALRSLFKSIGIPVDRLLVANRAGVRLDPWFVTTDVSEFEAALGVAEQSVGSAEHATRLSRAVELYRGKLLPGYYDDWIVTERERLTDAYLGALRQLSRVFQDANDFDRAIDYARRAVLETPERQENQCDLMRLYEATGRPAAALLQYENLERLVAVDGEEPGEEARELAAAIRQRAAGRAGSPPANSPRRLPLYLNSFRGREAEITNLLALVSGGTPPVRTPGTDSVGAPLYPVSHLPRLVTLTGPGGTGKTRLAVEVAKQLTEAFDGAVWFVSLADLSDPRLIPDSILDVLGVQRSATASPLEQVIAFLNRQPSLLMVDNCEHVHAEAARVILALLTQVPHLICLTTSRHRLTLEGEHEFSVDPLPTPTEAATPEQSLEYASVQLFMDRAKAAFPKLALKERDIGIVARLCDRLEGIPLAIELAAARASEFTPAKMLERISARFELLATTSIDKSERHRSLWAAIDWSFDLLPEELQRLFARLSVFRGGFTAEAVEAVCERPSASHYLTQLRNQSLIVTETVGDEMRSTLLVSLREFAAQQLEDAERTTLAERHADYFLAMAEQAEPNLHDAGQPVWVQRLQKEHDNLRAALDWFEAQEDAADVLLRFTATLGQFWHAMGHYAEGAARLDAALSRTESAGHTARRAWALSAAGVLAWDRGDATVAQSQLQESLTIFRKLDDRLGIARTLQYLGNIASDRSDNPSFSRYYTESLERFQELGNPYDIAWALNRVAGIDASRANNVAARKIYERSLAMFRELADARGIAWTLLSLGAIIGRDDHNAALSVLAECLARFRNLGDARGTAAALICCGILTAVSGNYDEARILSEEALAIFLEQGHAQGIAATLRDLGTMAMRHGDCSQARLRLVESLPLWFELGNLQSFGLVLQALAAVELKEGFPERAAFLVGAVDMLCEHLEQSGPPGKPDWYVELEFALHTALSADRLATTRSNGRAMQPEQLIAYVRQSLQISVRE